MWWLVFPWLAVVFISAGFWLQALKIHIHKEVRDLSISYHICLVIGYFILFLTAIHEESTIFMVKQISAFIPVVVILSQILKYRQSRWHDEGNPHCTNCKSELEISWAHCPVCGTKIDQLL